MANEIEKPNNPIAHIRGFLANVDVKKRFEEILGKRASAFTNSIINVVKNNQSLQKCSPESIMNSSLVAATMNLPIDPSLGYAAIVPYNNKGGSVAQFQLMYKGIIQLCIRSGQYSRIHNTEVYKDEIKLYNPITGEIIFNDPTTFKMRYDGDTKNIAGFYSYFKLSSGFECSNYISLDEAIAHGKRFSKAYQYDIKEHKKTSLWSTDIISMGKKTSLKMMLSKYGIMSIEMQDAFVAESQDFDDALIDASAKIDADAGSEVIDAAFEENPELEAKKKAQIDALNESEENLKPDWAK